MLSRVACHSVACSKGGDEPLKVHLRRVTDTGVANFPDEFLTPIIEASYDSDCRREIMNHLRECLSERSGKRCLRIYAGLVLIDKLMERGSPALVIETAHGYHFDLIQKISLLMNYDSAAQGCSNPFAQKAVREKAAKLHTQVISKLRLASAEELPQLNPTKLKETVSTGSSSTLSTCTGTSEMSTSRRSTFSDAFPKSQLEAELMRITDSGNVELPPDLTSSVVKASHDADARHVILLHLRDKCFIDTTERHWRPVYAGLCLIEQMCLHGPHNFIQDADAAGFNLTSQLWSLQEFEHRRDWKAQGAVRKKATLLFEKAIAGRSPDLTAQAQEHFEDAFASLRDWAEAPERSGSSTHPSSRPSSACHSDGFIECRGSHNLATGTHLCQTSQAKALNAGESTKLAL
mmetsp:Transcript_47910/g.111768  ORF Transcript_47910/g.111768 Transcript_47910/m.111768 type:complete len:405 (+) Transcript_47910:87-1301(+)